MVNKSDREGCHLCGVFVYIAPSADPHRRVLCARCTAEYPDDVETGPAAWETRRFAGLERGGPPLQLARGAGMVRIYLTADPSVHIHLPQWPVPPADLDAYFGSAFFDAPEGADRERFQSLVREANARKLEQAKTKT